MSRNHELLNLAQDLANRVPQSLADAITVIGSVSRGKADQYSDIDLLLFVETYPELETCQTWLDLMNSISLRPARLLPDSSMWFEFTYRDEPANLKWVSWALVDARMQVLRDIENRESPPFDSEDLLIPWIIQHAVILRDHPKLHLLKREAATIPEALRRKLIQQHIMIWRQMLKVPATFSARHVAMRGELPDFRRRQLIGIQSILTVLYAYNRLWMPDEKWLLSECAAMTHKPSQLEARIRLILTGQDLSRSIREQFDLFIETAALLQDSFDVEGLAEGLQAVRDAAE